MSKIQDAYTINDYKQIISENIEKNLLQYTLPGVSFGNDASQIPLMITGFHTIGAENTLESSDTFNIVALETTTVDPTSDEPLESITEKLLLSLMETHNVDNDALIMIELPESIDQTLATDCGVISVDNKQVKLATPQKLKLLTPAQKVSADSPILAFIEI